MNPTLADKYREERQDCYKKYKAAAELEDRVGLKQGSLSKGDYETIRDITYKLMKNSATMDMQDLKAEMEANNFRKY